MDFTNILSSVDLVIIFVYFAFIVYVGFIYSKSTNAESYFLAGRSMTWPVIGFSMFAASISSSTLIGQAGDAYSTGIAVFNYNLIPMIVMVFFVWFLLPFYIKSQIYTVPEFLGRRFGQGSRYYFSAVTIIVNIFLDAAGALYAAALVINLVFPDVPIITLVAIFAVIVALYTIPGGLSSAIRVDLIQGILLFIGTIILTVIISYRGGTDYIIDQINNNDIMMKLIRSNDDASVPWLGLVTGIPILGFFFWCNNQQLVQRALTAKNVNEARLGVILLGFLTLLTLFVVVIPGVMAQHFYPELEKVDMVYPTLILKMMPVGLVGLLIAVMVAALTSSLSGLLNSVATLFTMDFYSKMSPNATSKNKVWVGRIASCVTLVIAVFWAPQIGEKFGSLLKYYQEMLSVLAPPIVGAFLLGLFSKRVNKQGAFTGLMVGAALGATNLVFKIVTGVSIFGDLHFLLTVPYYLFASMAVMVIVSCFTPKPDYDVIKPYIWTLDYFREDSRELKDIPWYANYRYWSFLLLVSCLALLVVFQ
ncbi:MAG: sodium/solute symporter [Rikenellaceae bacterium]